eukprot:6741854-Prymnesium_polylepis.1
MRGLLGSRRVPSTWRADPSARVARRWFVRVSTRRPRGAGRAGVPMRPVREPGQAGWPMMRPGAVSGATRALRC